MHVTGSSQCDPFLQYISFWKKKLPVALKLSVRLPYHNNHTKTNNRYTLKNLFKLIPSIPCLAYKEFGLSISLVNFDLIV